MLHLGSMALGIMLVIPSLGSAQGGLAERLAELGATPCEQGSLTCLSIAVPRDHLANDPGETLDVTFAVSLATEESKGTLIYAVGGPGYSGLAVADDYLSAYDPDFVAQMDIVFFDQRGIGPVSGFACPASEAAYVQADLSLDAADDTISAAKAFVTDCLAELSSTDLLPFASTNQAARDVEQFRQAIGSPQIWIYGESYGTQFVQTYATLFPGSVDGVIVDGVVDLNLGFEAYYDVYSNTAEDVLGRVLAACADLPHCASDMGGDAVAVYDDLAARLAKSPIPVSLTAADGTKATRDLTSAMLETTAFYALFGPSDRSTLLRALAAASRDDFVPLVELSYSSLGVDIETEESAPDASWYGAAYYAITCSGYRSPEALPEDRARGIIASALARERPDLRMPRLYYSEPLACAFWPSDGPAARPAPFAGGDFPTIVLTSDSDPITPFSMAKSVFDQVQNGSMIVMEGGPHVIWGRDLACPDTIITSLIIDGALPESPVQICAQDLVDGYVPLTLTEAAGGSDPMTIAQAIESELAQSLRISMWDGESDLTVGCNHAGTVTVTASEEGTNYAFTGCAFWPGIAVDGLGLQIAQDLPGDRLTLNVKVSGDHQGDLTYVSDTWAEARQISGVFDGGPISPTSRIH